MGDLKGSLKVGGDYGITHVIRDKPPASQVDIGDIKYALRTYYNVTRFNCFYLEEPQFDTRKYDKYEDSWQPGYVSQVLKSSFCVNLKRGIVKLQQWKDWGSCNSCGWK